MTDLNQLREDIRTVDNEILVLLRKRRDLARAVGEYKASHGREVRDLSVEDGVVRRYREFAEENGMDPDKAEAVCRLVMEESVDVQEAIRR
ncbi:MAG: chorismate mutase [Candidatus Methanoplasma sp.]|jgi:chorismate mutase|nr:chorismate mutase [Candidatus Methanoplasma sp.]